MPRMRDPLWDHVTIDATYGTSGTKRWTCRYCRVSYTGGPSRIRAHLYHQRGYDIAPCQQAPTSLADTGNRARAEEHEAGPLMTRDVEESSTSRSASAAIRTTIGPPHISSQGEADGVGARDASVDIGASSEPCRGIVPSTRAHDRLGRSRQLGGRDYYVGCYDPKKKDKARVAVRRCFYSCDLPFHLASTPAWKDMMRSVSSIGCEWEGPTMEQLRTRELVAERDSVERDLDHIKRSWVKFGCTIILDGWSDTRKRHILNILVSSCMGTTFLRAIDAFDAGTSVTGEYMFRHIQMAIEDVGPANVVQVVTDNASNCVAMGRLVHEAYPHIFWMPCAAHCLDLLFEDIAKFPWIKEVLDTARSLMRFVTKRPRVLSMFRAHPQLKVLRPTPKPTRFSYKFIVLECLLKVRTSLMQMVVSNQWMEWGPSREPKSKRFEKLVLLGGSFWDEARAIITGLQPIYSVLHLTHSEGCTLGLLYEFMDRIGEQLRTSTVISADRLEEIRDRWQSRWDWFHPLHAVAHILHPLWRSPAQYRDRELRDGWNTYIQAVYPDPVDQDALMDDLLVFRNETLEFSSPSARLRPGMLRPVSWWDKYGIDVPRLQTLAIRVLSQDCTTLACERNWSVFSLIHTKRRNRLSRPQLDRLVYVHANLRLSQKLRKTREAIQVNPDEIDDLPPRDEVEDVYALLHEEAALIAGVTTRAAMRTPRRPRHDRASHSRAVEDDEPLASSATMTSDSEEYVDEEDDEAEVEGNDDDDDVAEEPPSRARRVIR